MCWTILKLPFKNHWCRTVWLPLNGTVGEGRTAERRGQQQLHFDTSRLPGDWACTRENGTTRLDSGEAAGLSASKPALVTKPNTFVQSPQPGGWEGGSCFANVCKHNSSLERQMQKTRAFGAVFTNTSRMGFLLTFKHAFQTPSSGQQL